MISQQAIIDPSARIAPDVSIGPWTRIEAHVEIGQGCTIDSHVVIEKNTKLGSNNRIYSHAILGSDPQHLGYKGEATQLIMGDNNVVREFVSINRATAATGVTKIGNHNYFMSYSHVAHDCVVGNHVIFANSAMIAGHVTVGDHAILGAYAGVHQFVTVGAYSFLGRATKIYQDVLPYMLITGNPGGPRSLNSVGLRRHGFNREALAHLKKAFQIIFRSGLTNKAIIAELESLNTTAKSDLIAHLLESIQTSQRGFARAVTSDDARASVSADAC